MAKNHTLVVTTPSTGAMVDDEVASFDDRVAAMMGGLQGGSVHSTPLTFGWTSLEQPLTNA